ncbi:MAG: beta-ketoacyl-ACP synthase III [Pseudomonadota bacterium]
MAVIRSVVRGCGASLPARCVSNAELAKSIDTSDEWIRERTGITQRYIASDGETTGTLAVAAGRQAIVRSGIDPEQIDLVVLATSTADQTFPATAVTVQDELNLDRNAAAFDMQAVCSGFVYALSTADAMLRGGAYRRALVVGSETFSRIMDWDDRGTCVLFGDGAGAVVIEAQPLPGTINDRGILSSRLHADGRYRDKLYVDGGPSSTKTIGFLRMNGREVFRHAVSKMSTVIEEVLVDTNVTAEEIDWFVPHQANRRIVDGIASKLGIPEEKVILTVDCHANTSAASIPLALNAAIEDGRLKEGDLVMLEAMGGGFTWGAVLLRW